MPLVLPTFGLTNVSANLMNVCKIILVDFLKNKKGAVKLKYAIIVTMAAIVIDVW